MNLPEEFAGMTMEEALERLVAQNSKTEEEIRMRGITLDHVALTDHLRLATLVKMVRDEDPELDMEYQVTYQLQVKEAFEQISGEARKAVLQDLSLPQMDQRPNGGIARP